MSERNPLLETEDYRAGYKESVENLKNNPKLVEFDKLCYETFSTEVGKKWVEYVIENYLIPPMADRNSPNFSINAVWAEGFKDFGRLIRMHIRSHEQRIAAEVNK